MGRSVRCELGKRVLSGEVGKEVLDRDVEEPAEVDVVGGLDGKLEHTGVTAAAPGHELPEKISVVLFLPFDMSVDRGDVPQSDARSESIGNERHDLGVPIPPQEGIDEIRTHGPVLLPGLLSVVD